MAFESSIPSSGGGGGQDFGDPAQYVGGSPQTGQPPDSQMANPNPEQAKASPDFVRAIGRQGMQLKTTLQTLSGQHSEAAEDFRQAIKAIDAGIAKILTTNPQAPGGPQAPRLV